MQYRATTIGPRTFVGCCHFLIIQSPSTRACVLCLIDMCAHTPQGWQQPQLLQSAHTRSSGVLGGRGGNGGWGGRVRGLQDEGGQGRWSQQGQCPGQASPSGQPHTGQCQE